MASLLGLGCPEDDARLSDGPVVLVDHAGEGLEEVLAEGQATLTQLLLLCQRTVDSMMM
jgi:hypothetical protein